MNNEIQERLVEVVRHLHNRQNELIFSYEQAKKDLDLDKMDKEFLEYSYISDEISEIYYIVTGEHVSSIRVKKALNII